MRKVNDNRFCIGGCFYPVTYDIFPNSKYMRTLLGYVTGNRYTSVRTAHTSAIATVGC
jgi:hypothetical protein